MSEVVIPEHVAQPLEKCPFREVLRQAAMVIGTGIIDICELCDQNHQAVCVTSPAVWGESTTLIGQSKHICADCYRSVFGSE